MHGCVCVCPCARWCALPSDGAVFVTGAQDSIDAIIATLEVLPEPYKSMASTLVEICAYAGEMFTGFVASV